MRTIKFLLAAIIGKGLFEKTGDLPLIPSDDQVVLLADLVIFSRPLLFGDLLEPAGLPFEFGGDECCGRRELCNRNCKITRQGHVNPPRVPVR